MFAEALEFLATPPASPVPEPVLAVPAVPEVSAGRRAVRAVMAGLPDHPLKDCRDLELQLKLKYGLDHIKQHAGVGDYFSVHSHFSDGQFRPLADALQAPRVVSDRLLEEMKAFDDGGAAASALEVLGASSAAPHAMEIEDDIGVSSGGANYDKDQYTKGVRHKFFKILQKAPKKIRGATGDRGNSLATGEIVVDILPVLFVQKGEGGGAYIYSDHNSQESDISLMAPSDVLVARLTRWQTDPNKFFWSQSFDVGMTDIGPALEAIRMQYDIGAFESTDVRYSLPTDDIAKLTIFKKIEASGIMVCVGDGPISSWQLARQFVLTMEPVTRCHSRAYVVVTPTLDIPIASMSILDLVGQLEYDGWQLELWLTRGVAPPPVVIKTLKPKKLYTMLTGADGSPVLSKAYLICLNVAASITIQPEIEHFQTDKYYKWLSSNGRQAKRVATANIEDDTGLDRRALADIERSKRRRAVAAIADGGGHDGIGGSRKGRAQTKDPRTHYWGRALITFSGKSVQATCHR